MCRDSLDSAQERHGARARRGLTELRQSQAPVGTEWAATLAKALQLAEHSAATTTRPRARAQLPAAVGVGPQPREYWGQEPVGASAYARSSARDPCALQKPGAWPGPTLQRLAPAQPPRTAPQSSASPRAMLCSWSHSPPTDVARPCKTREGRSERAARPCHCSAGSRGNQLGTSWRRPRGRGPRHVGGTDGACSVSGGVGLVQSRLGQAGAHWQAAPGHGVSAACGVALWADGSSDWERADALSSHSQAAQEGEGGQERGGEAEASTPGMGPTPPQGQPLCPASLPARGGGGRARTGEHGAQLWG